MHGEPHLSLVPCYSVASVDFLLVCPYRPHLPSTKLMFTPETAEAAGTGAPLCCDHFSLNCQPQAPPPDPGTSAAIQQRHASFTFTVFSLVPCLVYALTHFPYLENCFSLPLSF